MQSAAALVAIVAALSLAAQWRVSAALMAGAEPVAVVWRMLGYFTVLGNLATMMVMAAFGIRGKIQPRRAALISVVMIVIGVGYHSLLAGIWQPEGLAWWADQGLHSAVPVLTVLWWAVYAPKAGLRWNDSLRWLVWPMAYAGYALLRGLDSGFYPYPFLDLSRLSIGQVVMNVGGLAASFVMIGVAVICAARLSR